MDHFAIHGLLLGITMAQAYTLIDTNTRECRAVRSYPPVMLVQLSSRVTPDGGGRVSTAALASRPVGVHPDTNSSVGAPSRWHETKSTTAIPSQKTKPS